MNNTATTKSWYLVLIFIHISGISAYDTNCDNFDSALNTIFSSSLCGELFLPTDDAAYLTAKQQYAYSTFPDRVEPSMIIEAVCDEDIKLAISYAKQCDYTISVRSGGHQYSGLSSCNTSCIQIDMAQYNHIEIEDEDNISMGPGVKLGEMFSALDQNELNLPGGTCSGVALGGHVQTGGLGHTLRSHGALLDYVTAFDIILSDAETYHITKPDMHHKNQYNEDLYWSVMGGNPGSWGIVTNYEFMANKNEDTSTSTIVECSWLYNGDVLKELLSNFIDIHNDDAYLNDPNNGIWFTVVKGEPATTNVMRIQCFWAGLNNQPFNSTYCDKLFDTVKMFYNNFECVDDLQISISKAHTSVWTYYIEREFPFPYVKSHRISNVNLKYEFIDEFISRLDEIFMNPINGVFMVMELISIGGAGSRLYEYDRHNKITSLSNRNALISLVTDLFYAESINPNSKQIALDWRETAWNEWFTAKTFNDGQDKRMTWSTFQSVNIDDVWRYYYEPKQYEKLKQIKRIVDPINLFQNQFTIPIDPIFNTDTMHIEETDNPKISPWMHAYFRHLVIIK